MPNSIEDKTTGKVGISFIYSCFHDEYRHEKLDSLGKVLKQLVEDINRTEGWKIKSIELIKNSSESEDFLESGAIIGYKGTDWGPVVSSKLFYKEERKLDIKSGAISVLEQEFLKLYNLKTFISVAGSTAEVEFFLYPNMPKDNIEINLKVEKIGKSESVETLQTPPQNMEEPKKDPEEPKETPKADENVFSKIQEKYKDDLQLYFNDIHGKIEVGTTQSYQLEDKNAAGKSSSAQSLFGRVIRIFN
ncbi:MAG: hypothetical protein IPM82_07395 [Saprospiraceae bacterium]|nr:hypothetical protein [Saprospiraceae bacterium]